MCSCIESWYTSSSSFIGDEFKSIIARQWWLVLYSIQLSLHVVVALELHLVALLLCLWLATHTEQYQQLHNCKHSSLMHVWTNKCQETLYWYIVHIFFISVGRPKHVRVMAGALEGDTFIGPKAEVCGRPQKLFLVLKGEFCLGARNKKSSLLRSKIPILLFIYLLQVFVCFYFYFWVLQPWMSWIASSLYKVVHTLSFCQVFSTQITVECR